MSDGPQGTPVTPAAVPAPAPGNTAVPAPPAATPATPEETPAAAEPPAAPASLLSDDGEGASDSSEAPASLLADEPVARSEAPESYEAYTMPEGVTMDEAMTDSFNALAKRYNLDQAGAQEFVNLHASQVNAARAADTALLNAQTAEWQKEITSTPEGLENVKRAKRVIKSHLTDAQRDLFVGEGAWLGSHPAVISMLASFDRKLGEDTPPSGNTTPAPKSTRPCDVMFPDLAGK